MENQTQVFCRALRLEDIEEVQVFLDKSEELNDSEDIFKSWSSSFRKESLEHYLSLNWSFGSYRSGVLCGVILQQPFLFCNGLAQSLWVENLSAETDFISQMLFETTYKTAREKHLQKLMLSKQRDWSSVAVALGLMIENKGQSQIIKTASWSSD